MLHYFCIQNNMYFTFVNVSIYWKIALAQLPTQKQANHRAPYGGSAGAHVHKILFWDMPCVTRFALLVSWWAGPSEFSVSKLGCGGYGSNGLIQASLGRLDRSPAANWTCCADSLRCKYASPSLFAIVPLLYSGGLHGGQVGSWCSNTQTY
jgi:hypothetical protein